MATGQEKGVQTSFLIVIYNLSLLRKRTGCLRPQPLKHDLVYPYNGCSFLPPVLRLSHSQSVATTQAAGSASQAFASTNLALTRGRNPAPPLCHWRNTVSPGASQPFPQRSPASLA